MSGVTPSRGRMVRRERYHWEQPRDFTVRKETLWESETTSDSEVSFKEAVYVGALKSNAPSVG